MLERQQMTPEEKRRRASEKTILIVEDNELNMKLFHDLIQAHGYNILQTKDGMEALKLARQHKPDLILMDIQLPEVSRPGSHQVDQGRRQPQIHSHHCGHGVRDEGRRGEDPRGRLRGLYRQADLRRSIPGNRRPLLAVGRVPMSARVLVVDDIAANVRLLEAKLAAEYFEVMTASERQGSARAHREADARHRAPGRHDAGAGRVRGVQAHPRQSAHPLPAGGHGDGA